MNTENSEFEIGIYSFGELFPSTSGASIGSLGAFKRIDEIITLAKLADEVGLDIFGIGADNRIGFVTSSYAIIMSAIAQATKQIRLTSSLSVVSTADPVRVFEDFATIDLISGGRAEMIADRGALLESSHLFRADIKNYDELFENKLDLFLELNKNESITRPFQKSLPTWVGVSGCPATAERAGKLGLNMVLDIFGRDLEGVKPLVDIYREAGRVAGHDPSKLRVSVTDYYYLAKTAKQALDVFQPYFFTNYFSHLMKERGHQFGVSRSDLDPLTAPVNVLEIGSPQQLIEKILYQHELFGHSRFMGYIDMGRRQSFSKVATSIELLATKVAPVVRREIRKNKPNVRKQRPM